jgi:hypothetical protein
MALMRIRSSGRRNVEDIMVAAAEILCPHSA